MARFAILRHVVVVEIRARWDVFASTCGRVAVQRDWLGPLSFMVLVVCHDDRD